MFENACPNYSLFFEIAVAIGGTLLVVFFCSGKRGRKRKEEENVAYIKPEISDGNNNEQRSDKVRKRVIGSDNTSVKSAGENETRQQVAKEPCEPELTQENVTNDVISRAEAQTSSEVMECTRVTSVARATQTEATLVDDKVDESEEYDGSDMAIMWRGVLVNGNESASQMRYRTELHMKIDGAISHCESFRKEGFVGAGIEQVLIKVQ